MDKVLLLDGPYIKHRYIEATENRGVDGFGVSISARECSAHAIGAEGLLASCSPS
jgi:hypothetical protein